MCKQRRPATTQPCELQACPYWFAGDWSDVSQDLSPVAVPCLRSINGLSSRLYSQTLNIASPKRYKQLHRKALVSSFGLNVNPQQPVPAQSVVFPLFFSVNCLFISSVTNPPPPAGTGVDISPGPRFYFSFARTNITTFLGIISSTRESAGCIQLKSNTGRPRGPFVDAKTLQNKASEVS